jgi:hypothetical protein
MPRVIHFELQADDPDRATKFYEDVFGWQTARWGDGPQSYWLMTTGPEAEPGINGGIMRRDARFPGVVNTLAVPDVDDYCEKVTRAGGQVFMPRSAVAGIGWVAYCRDTEGNMFGVFKSDPAAK